MRKLGQADRKFYFLSYHWENYAITSKNCQLLYISHFLNVHDFLPIIKILPYLDLLISLPNKKVLYILSICDDHASNLCYSSLIANRVPHRISVME